jgi:DNA-binding NtrC family response regulator
VRVIAATSRKPEIAVEQGSLRRNLPEFFDSAIEVPPLRERRDDIAPLVDHFIVMLRERSGRPIYAISERALDVLRALDWPGNVGELREMVESAFNTAKGQIIEESDVTLRRRRSTAEQSTEVLFPSGRARPNIASFSDLERDLIQRALESTRGNKLQAAKLLKISRKKLYSRLEKFNL